MAGSSAASATSVAIPPDRFRDPTGQFSSGTIIATSVGLAPDRFRRQALLAALLAEMAGQDPDADLPPADRVLAREIRRRLWERHAGLEGLDDREAERVIRRAAREARRALRRRARRLAGGREWAE